MTRHPVALFVLNFPKQTKVIFERIRQATPSILLLIADMSRSGYKNEDKKCSDVRRIVSQADWEFQFITDYSETNMGCKLRVPSGLDFGCCYITHNY